MNSYVNMEAIAVVILVGFHTDWRARHGIIDDDDNNTSVGGSLPFLSIYIDLLYNNNNIRPT